MVKSKKVYSHEKYLEAMTGMACFPYTVDVVGRIHAKLMENGIEDEENFFGDYPLDEIDHIVENELDVVLVDVSGFEDDDDWHEEYRWFEVPDNFEDEEE